MSASVSVEKYVTTVQENDIAWMMEIVQWMLPNKPNRNQIQVFVPCRRALTPSCSPRHQPWPSDRCASITRAGYIVVTVLIRPFRHGLRTAPHISTLRYNIFIHSYSRAHFAIKCHSSNLLMYSSYFSSHDKNFRPY
jgi:hypothetical protein